MAREYKVMKHKMEAIDKKMQHSQLHLLKTRKQSGEADYSPMMEALKIELSVASPALKRNIEQLEQEFSQI